MLSKDNKISKTKYPTLLKASKSVNFDGSNIRFSNIDGQARFSVIISNKVSKKAVQRNLIKRIVYNKIKNLKINEKISKKAIFIYIAKDFGIMSRSKISQKAEELVNKICLYFQKV